MTPPRHLSATLSSARGGQKFSLCTGGEGEQLVWGHRADSHRRPLLMGPQPMRVPKRTDSQRGWCLQIQEPPDPLALVSAFTDLVLPILPREALWLLGLCFLSVGRKVLAARKILALLLQPAWPRLPALSPRPHRWVPTGWVMTAWQGRQFLPAPAPTPRLTHVGEAQWFTTSSSPICGIRSSCGPAAAQEGCASAYVLL